MDGKTVPAGRAGKIVAFANQKGGVGKSTSVVNMAASVGQSGCEVLVVDADPQGNTTSGFGIAKRGLERSVYDVLIGRIPARDAVVRTPFEGISVLPANITLAGAEFELVTESGRESCLRDALAPLRDSYDYVFIDCPPSIGILTINALTAADGVVIPMQCEYYSLEGLSQLMNSIRQIRQRYNPSLEVTGLLLTMYNGRLSLTTQVLDELKKYYAPLLFSVPIARNVKLTEAPGFGMPVVYYDKNSKGAEQYAAAAAELTERLNAAKGSAERR